MNVSSSSVRNAEALEKCSAAIEGALKVKVGCVVAQGSSAAAEGCSARCTGTATSTIARSTTGSWARRRFVATTPSSCRKRYTRYEPPAAPRPQPSSHPQS